ncbi:MAG: TolC family protein [Myxococcales bacterium]|nr:TolC family protein [Myxococcales bacterium]
MALEARSRAAEQVVPQAASLPDPKLQWTYFVEPVQTRTGPQKSVFTLSQRFPWFGKLGNSKKSASAEAEASWHTFQSRQLTLMRSVSIGFFEYGFLGRAIDLTRENRDWLLALEPVIEEKVKAGGDINPLLRLKVEIGKVDDALQSLKQRRRVESARLSELLALADDTLLPWPEWDAPAVVALDAPSLARAVENDNPELHVLTQKVDSAKARREVARRESYPDITAGLNYIQLGDPVVNPGTPDAGKDPWGVTVAVNIPLFLKRNKAAKTEATFTQTSFERQYDQKLNELQAELRSSLALLEDAHRRLLLYGEELLGLAEQAVENSRTSYVGGRTGILEVIDSERSLLELQLLYWRAASDAWQQRVTIQTLANQPISLTSETAANDEDQ